MILVYTLVFSNVMKAKLPGVGGSFSYSIYLCAGVLTWGLFVEILGRNTNIFLESANLLKKINFPKICLPIIVITSSILNYSIIWGLFTVFLIVTGQFPSFLYFEFIIVITILVLFVSSLGIVLGTLNVFFRDIGQLVNVIVQFWFWFTPIVYPSTIIPDWADKILSVNPMRPIIKSMQNIFVQHEHIEFLSLVYPLVLGLLLALLSLRLLRKHMGEIVDEI